MAYITHNHVKYMYINVRILHNMYYTQLCLSYAS